MKKTFLTGKAFKDEVIFYDGDGDSVRVSLQGFKDNERVVIEKDEDGTWQMFRETLEEIYNG